MCPEKSLRRKSGKSLSRVHSGGGCMRAGLLARVLDYTLPERVSMQVVMCPEKSHPQENKEKALLGYTQAVDAWALGVLAYELIVGHPPFERETRTDTYDQIMYRRPYYPAMLSEAPRTFISAALTKVRILKCTKGISIQSFCKCRRV